MTQRISNFHIDFLLLLLFFLFDFECQSQFTASKKNDITIK